MQNVGDAFVIHFYPRSPCGERPPRLARVVPTPIFLSTLSLRRATSPKCVLPWMTSRFLSTLSLRRATRRDRAQHGPCSHFYPRSPCGERRRGEGVGLANIYISIHALLAESDLGNVEVVSRMWNFYPRSPCGERQQLTRKNASPKSHFYPRSPCGERQSSLYHGRNNRTFLSTLSLRRATRQRRIW